MYKASAQTPYCLSGPGPEIEVCGYSQTRPHTSHSYVHTNTYSCAILCRHPQVPLICINKHMYTHACTPTCTQLVFTVPHTHYLTLTVAYTHTHELTWHIPGACVRPRTVPGTGMALVGKGKVSSKYKHPNEEVDSQELGREDWGAERVSCACGAGDHRGGLRSGVPWGITQSVSGLSTGCSSFW